jgi:hypothetical protein
MKLKQKIKAFLISAVAIAGIIAPLTPTLVSADGTCAGVKTSIISCSQTGGQSSDPKQSGIWGILILAINILTAGVGLAAVGGVIYGAVLYTTAGGAQEQVKKAIGILTNVAIGVVAYAIMWAFLNFLIPGGVF